MGAKTTFLEQLPDARERIERMVVVLNHVKTNQTVDGAAAATLDAQVITQQYAKLLCAAGFLWDANIPEGGLTYRITWKGENFLDTVAIFKQLEADEKSTDTQRLIAALAMLSIH